MKRKPWTQQYLRSLSEVKPLAEALKFAFPPTELEAMLDHTRCILRTGYDGTEGGVGHKILVRKRKTDGALLLSDKTMLRTWVIPRELHWPFYSVLFCGSEVEEDRPLMAMLLDNLASMTALCGWCGRAVQMRGTWIELPCEVRHGFPGVPNSTGICRRCKRRLLEEEGRRHK